MNYIVNSLLDTDWYILTMAQMFLHQHPSAIGYDKFKCRNPEKTLFNPNGPSFKTQPELIDRLEENLDKLCTLNFKDSELNWLYQHKYFKVDYIDWLQDLRLKRRYINVIRNNDGTFDVNIDGPITQTIWFEVPTLYIISQLYGEVQNINPWYTEKVFKDKLNYLNRYHGFNIADFGTRRRHSYSHQENLIKTLINYPNFVGTSNAYFAYKYNTKPIGTMAHKVICAYQQLGTCRIGDSQKTMFQDWAKEYRGELGIALSDTLGFNKFLKDFDKYFAKLFDGVRHDSGDPIYWGNELIEKYKSYNIHPMTKTAVFSDGLNFKKALDLYIYFKEKIKTSFGIETNLTNDVGYIAPQIVIKLIMCNGNPVAKISDDPGKLMCEDKNYIDYLISIR